MIASLVKRSMSSGMFAGYYCFIPIPFFSRYKAKLNKPIMNIIMMPMAVVMLVSETPNKP